MIVKRKSLPKSPWPELWRVNVTDTCWDWLGSLSRGYGHIAKQPAHRVSWEYHNGPIPDGLHVLHRCDRRRCVNPAHLFLGTNAENMEDKMRKGRWRGKVKLTPEQVVAIFIDTRIDQKSIAADYGITAGNVSMIKCRRSWRSITDSLLAA